MKYYVVSDVHGFYSELIKSLQDKGFFEDVTPHKLLILGDYFDRGQEARKMQEFLVNEIKKDEVILIRGNHEDLVEEFVDNVNSYSLNLLESHHFRNSTVNTCCQLTGYETYEIIDDKQGFVEKMKQTDLFKTILNHTIDYLETKHYIFTHGCIPCYALNYGDPGTFSYREDWRKATKNEWVRARWFNGMQAYKEGVREKGKTLVIGHWHASYGHSELHHECSQFGEDAIFTPFKDDGILAIDGCVPRSGMINCVVIEDEDL